MIQYLKLPRLLILILKLFVGSFGATNEKSNKESNEIIPYKGRYIITILKEDITVADHRKKVELARKIVSKGLMNYKKA